MLDPLSMLAGAALVGVGYGSGRVGRVRRRPRVVKPLCGCKHHKSYHEGGGRCSFVGWFSGERCKCKGYVGPQELPEYYSPEISG